MEHQNKEDTSANCKLMWPGGKACLRGDQMRCLCVNLPYFLPTTAIP